MRSLARHQGTQVAVAGIKSDMLSNDTNSLDEDTVSSYIEDPKKIFVDPSIAVAALGIGSEDLISDLNTMGLFYGTMAVRDLRVNAEALSGVWRIGAPTASMRRPSDASSLRNGN